MHDQIIRAEQQAAYDRQQKYIARQVAFINATRANAARSALAKSRERALAKLERVSAPRPEPARITLKLTHCGKRLLAAAHVSKLTAKATFTAAGRPGITATTTFRLRT